MNQLVSSELSWRELGVTVKLNATLFAEGNMVLRQIFLRPDES